ncbi:MAG: hypothetical protein KAH48_07795, partial [Chlorobi bacterium]|nr:hypothetical protein [Chlorobiota bacterium]
RELLSNSIYQQYEEINREQSFIKGRLNVNAYINENLSRGNWHKLNCTYDSFVFDNKFNRIIKYVTNILINASKNDENKKNLREILFILDEVSDERATAEECGAIKFNPVFEEFATVRDYCYLFLNNSISFDYKNDLKLFAFLLPMEYVFEDFIFGFIEKEIDGVNAKAQTSSIHLDVEKKFTLKPDLILEVGKKQIIADTKYKLIYFDDKDEKKAASQTDLYQMLAYAVRFEIDKIILFYPDTIQKPGEHSREIRIKDEFREKKEKEISVKSYQLPIINHAMFKQKSWKEQDLSKMFEETKGTLVKTIEGIRDLI